MVEAFLYVGEDITSKQLSKHSFPDDIEGIFVEVNLRKTKWLILGTYHPPSQPDKVKVNITSKEQSYCSLKLIYA